MSRNDSGDEPCALGEGTITVETAKAVLCVFDKGGQLWVPKAVVHDDSEVWKKDDTGRLVVKTWWAEKNGHV